MPLPLPLRHRVQDDIVSSHTQRDFGQLAFVLLGAGSLIPWNSIILAIDFLASICPHYHVGQISSALALSAVICNVASLSLCVKLGIENIIPVKTRVVGGFAAQCVIFASIVFGSMFLKQETSDTVTLREMVLFKLIIVFGCLLGTSDSIVQGGLVGYASKLSPRYAQSLMAGQSVGGLLLCGVRILSKLSSGSAAGRSAEELFILSKLSANIFFASAGCVILGCLYLFANVEKIKSVSETISAQRIVKVIRSLSREDQERAMGLSAKAPTLPTAAAIRAASPQLETTGSPGLKASGLPGLKRRMSQYTMQVKQNLRARGRNPSKRTIAATTASTKTTGTSSSTLAGPSPPTLPPPTNLKRQSSPHKKQLLRRIRGCSLSVAGVFFVSVIAWPSICSQITSVRPDPGHWFPIKLALAWGVGELAGRKYAEGKMMSARIAGAPIALRAALIPLFVAMVKEGLGAWQDVIAIAAVAVMGSTLGFFSSVMTAYAANKAELHERERAGQFVQFCIAIGLASGSLAAFLLNKFVILPQ